MKSVLIGEVVKKMDFCSVSGAENVKLAICPFGSMNNEIIEKWNNPKKDKGGNVVAKDHIYDELNGFKEGDVVAVQVNHFYDYNRKRESVYINFVYPKEQAKAIYEQCKPSKGVVKKAV